MSSKFEKNNMIRSRLSRKAGSMKDDITVYFNSLYGAKLTKLEKELAVDIRKKLKLLEKELKKTQH